MGKLTVILQNQKDRFPGIILKKMTHIWSTLQKWLYVKTQMLVMKNWLIFTTQDCSFLEHMLIQTAMAFELRKVLTEKNSIDIQ